MVLKIRDESLRKGLKVEPSTLQAFLLNSDFILVRSDFSSWWFVCDICWVWTSYTLYATGAELHRFTWHVSCMGTRITTTMSFVLQRNHMVSSKTAGLRYVLHKINLKFLGPFINPQIGHESDLEPNLKVDHISYEKIWFVCSHWLVAISACNVNIAKIHFSASKYSKVFEAADLSELVQSHISSTVSVFSTQICCPFLFLSRRTVTAVTTTVAHVIWMKFHVNINVHKHILYIQLGLCNLTKIHILIDILILLYLEGHTYWVLATTYITPVSQLFLLLRLFLQM